MARVSLLAYVGTVTRKSPFPTSIRATTLGSRIQNLNSSASTLVYLQLASQKSLHVSHCSLAAGFLVMARRKKHILPDAARVLLERGGCRMVM